MGSKRARGVTAAAGAARVKDLGNASNYIKS